MEAQELLGQSQSIPGCQERVPRGSWARDEEIWPASPALLHSLGEGEAETGPSGWAPPSLIPISRLHGEKSVSAPGQQCLYLPPQVPSPLSVMIIKPCQQIWNQWMQLHRRVLGKPPCLQVFIIQLENWWCHKTSQRTRMNCLVSNKKASSGSCRRRRGMSQGAPLALPTLEHCGTNISAPALWIVLWRKNRVKENNVLPLTLIHSSCLTFDCVRLGRSCGLLGGMKHGLVSREDGGSYRFFTWNEK